MVTRSLLHLAHGFRTSVDRNYFFKGLYWTLTCQPIRNVYNPSVRRHKIKVVTHTHFFFTLILIFACFSPSSVLLFTRLLPLNKIMVMKAGKVAFQISRFVSVSPLASLDIPTVSLVPRIHNETQTTGFSSSAGLLSRLVHQYFKHQLLPSIRNDGGWESEVLKHRLKIVSKPFMALLWQHLRSKYFM